MLWGRAGPGRAVQVIPELCMEHTNFQSGTGVFQDRGTGGVG